MDKKAKAQSWNKQGKQASKAGCPQTEPYPNTKGQGGSDP